MSGFSDRLTWLIIGRFVKIHRLTPSALAALTHYERKADNPNADFVGRVAKLFNVSVDELLDHSVKPVKKTGPRSQLEERLSAIRQLSRDKQKVVLQFLDSFLQTNAKSSR